MKTQTKYQKIDTWCPLFPGFYETFYSFDFSDCEYALFNDPDAVKEAYPKVYEWIMENLYDYVDYSAYRNATAEAFVEALLDYIREELPGLSAIIKGIEYQTVQSPKEYNFQSDSINIAVDVNLAELCKLFVNSQGVREYLKARYTSCSGFISHYSNDLDEFLADEDIAHTAGTMLEYLIEPDIFEHYKMDLWETVHGNVEQWGFLDYGRLVQNLNEFNSEQDKPELTKPITNISNLEI